jgi:hypothetical protein
MAPTYGREGWPVKASDPKLVRVAGRLAGMIEVDSCALVGALAAAAHGYVRATRDVDLVTRIPLTKARDRLVQHGVKASLRRGDVLAGEFPCVGGVLEGVEFDVLPPLVPIEWETTVELQLAGGNKLRVVDAQTLIHLKLRAGGPQDVLDAVMLLQQHPEHLARARELATAYGVKERLESFLSDPRIQSKMPRRSRARPSRSRKT